MPGHLDAAHLDGPPEALLAAGAEPHLFEHGSTSLTTEPNPAYHLDTAPEIHTAPPPVVTASYVSPQSLMLSFCNSSTAISPLTTWYNGASYNPAFESLSTANNISFIAEAPIQDQYPWDSEIDLGIGPITAQHIEAPSQDRDHTYTPPAAQPIDIGPHSPPALESITSPVHKRAWPTAPGNAALSVEPQARRVTNKTKDQGPLDAGQAFICPFVFHDARKYRGCLKRELRRIRDVKQHLRRYHRQPPYCGRCKVVFSDRAEADLHAQQQQGHSLCPHLLDLSPPDGVTETDNDWMKKYPQGADKNNEVAQWNTVWDNLFPQRRDAKPPSPFKDEHLSEELMALFVFSQTPYFLQTLEANPLLQPDDIGVGLFIVERLVEAFKWVAM